jgi:general secretion pathway protein I
LSHARSRAAAGFTLLEAIVALVVFSMGAFALYGWLATNVQTLERIQARRDAAATRASALDLMESVNPMAEPDGRRALGRLEVRWRARALAPPRASVTQVGLPNLFQVGLYQVDVRVLDQTREVDRFDVRRVGYRQVGKLELD